MKFIFNPRKYENSKQLRETITEYFNSIPEGEVPNPAALRLHCGITRFDVANWKRMTDCADLAAEIERAEEVIESFAWADMHSGRGKFGEFYLARVRKYIELKQIKLEEDKEAIGLVAKYQKMENSEFQKIMEKEFPTKFVE